MATSDRTTVSVSRGTRNALMLLKEPDESVDEYLRRELGIDDRVETLATIHRGKERWDQIDDALDDVIERAGAAPAGGA